MKTLPLCLLFLALAATLGAEPIVLAEPAIGAAHAPDNITLGAGDDGFLLAGTGSNWPVVIPLSPAGDPQTEGTLRLEPVTAQGVDEPLWINDRWVVLITPDHLLPHRMPIAEVASDGSLVGTPHIIPWERFRTGDLAWNGRTFLAAAITDRTTTILKDLRIRTVTADLASAGPPRLVANEVRFVAVAGTPAGFLLAWTDATGVWAQHLDDAGEPAAEPSQLSASDAGQLQIAVNGEDALVLWSEGGSTSVVHSRAGGTFRPIDPLEELPGDGAPVALVEPLAEGFVIVRQLVHYSDQGHKLGGQIVLQQLNGDGTPTGDSWSLPNLAGGELLAAIASRGDDLLITYTRHIAGVANPVWGTLVRDRSATTPRFVAVARASAQDLAITSGGDGTTWGSWSEATATGSSLEVARWNSSGEQIARSTLLDLPGRLGSVDIASNGPDTILTWHQGYAVFAAPLADDGTFEREPVYVAIGTSSYFPSSPVIEWDGQRFVIAWLDRGGIMAAHMVPEGVQRVLGVVAAAPPDTDQFYYGVRDFDLAANGEILGIAATIGSSPSCVGIVCPSQDFAAWTATDGSSAEVFQLGGPGNDATVTATDDGFLMSWRDVDGVQVMPFDHSGHPGTPRLAFRWPHAGAPILVSGNDQVRLAFSYATSNWGRVALITLDDEGDRIGPVRGFDSSAFTIEVADNGSDLLIAWTSFGSESERSIMGQLASGAEVNPQPPSTPTGVKVTPTGKTSVTLEWNPVSGADEYQIDHRYQSDYDGQYRWHNTTRTEATSLTTHMPPLRIIALGKGGASEPRVVGAADGRRRGVARP